MPIDYSKWKDIEVSDDEDDTHPNIDTPSLYRWRHQARLERMSELKQKKDDIFQNEQKLTREIGRLREQIDSLKVADPAQAEKLQVQLSELEQQNADFRKKEDELEKQEKLSPWNVDTISKEGFSKSRINKAELPKPIEETEEEREEKAVDFWQKNGDLIKKFCMFSKFEDSKDFLLDNPHLCCDETANYMVIECLNLEMEGKHKLMEHVAHQNIIMQFLLELAKSLEMPPHAAPLISSFFNKMKLANEQYMDGFNDELSMFKDRIRKRAVEKIEEARKEVEEEEKQARIGPGGLDPLEVMESLPASLRECFELKDIQMLQDRMAELDPAEASTHLKRCIDSGLWVPEGGKKPEENGEPAQGQEENITAMESDDRMSEGQELRQRKS